MRAIVVSIGDELVLGQTADTNAAWLSARLAELGVAVVEHVTVGDNQSDIEAALRRSAAEVLVATGGLGPTEDDLTRRAAAAALGAELAPDEASQAQIERFFQRLGRPMAERNRVQALIPRGCRAIPNETGTAPGIEALLPRAQGAGQAADGGRTGKGVGVWAFFLPGVPGEMKAMFRAAVQPRLTELLAAGGGKGVIVSRTLHVIGAGESNVAERLDNLMERGRNPAVNTTAALGMVSIRINARAADEEAARALIGPVEAQVRERLGALVYGADEETLGEVAGRLLREQGATVTTAESCTGGLLGKLFTDVPGASDYFRCGWVAYSNEAKTALLGVKKGVLAEHGAVSEPVVRQMATGARRGAGTDYALAVTGIAGPSGGTPEKPVGLVYLALAAGDGVQVERWVLPGDRDGVRQRSVLVALDMLRRRLLGA